MEELTIYKFQAEHIQDTLRLVSRLLKSESKTTSMDRDIVQAKAMIENCLAGKIDTHVPRL
ncbi:hypothetical protein [Pontibacter sp. H249]|uniref:hypothetical protein n=1 Tax=Pontibacter sp. H249 TaxID=3133420 RepID=UPI0030BB5A18